MIGNVLKKLRNLKDISQKELAKILGLSAQSTITAIEKNINNPTLPSFNQISSYFGVSADFLLGKKRNDLGYLKLLFSFKLKKQMNKNKHSIADVSNITGLTEEEILKIRQCGTLNNIYHYIEISKYINIDMKLVNDIINESIEKYREDKISILIPIVKELEDEILNPLNITGYMQIIVDTYNYKHNYFAIKCIGKFSNLKYMNSSLLVLEKTEHILDGDICIIKGEDNKFCIRKLIMKEGILILVVLKNGYTTSNMQLADINNIKVIGKLRYAINDINRDNDTDYDYENSNNYNSTLKK